MCVYGGRTTWKCGHTTGLDELSEPCNEVKELRRNGKPYLECPKTPDNTQPPKEDKTDACIRCQDVLAHSNGEGVARSMLGDDAYDKIAPSWDQRGKWIRPTPRPRPSRDIYEAGNEDLMKTSSWINSQPRSRSHIDQEDGDDLYKSRSWLYPQHASKRLAMPSQPRTPESTDSPPK